MMSLAAQRLQQRGLLGFGGVEQGGEMAARDDDAVAEPDREAIAVNDGELILGHDAAGVSRWQKGQGLDAGWGHALDVLMLFAEKSVNYPVILGARRPPCGRGSGLLGNGPSTRLDAGQDARARSIR